MKITDKCNIIGLLAYVLGHLYHNAVKTRVGKSDDLWSSLVFLIDRPISILDIEAGLTICMFGIYLEPIMNNMRQNGEISYYAVWG